LTGRGCKTCCKNDYENLLIFLKSSHVDSYSARPPPKQKAQDIIEHYKKDPFLYKL
jgi:hypothetical protein